MHPSSPPHHVDISGDVEYRRAGGDRIAQPESLHFSAGTAVSADDVHVALLLASGVPDVRFELDGIGSLQADGLLWVTLTIRFLGDDDWPEEPEAADAWSTVVSVDTSSPFTLRIEGEDREWAEARGTIVHRASAAPPPVPISRSAP